MNVDKIISKGEFEDGVKLSHKDHVHIGYTLLHECVFYDAERMFESIVEDFTEANGISGLYDAGTTRRWLGRIERALACDKGHKDFEEFWANHPELHESDRIRKARRLEQHARKAGKH